MKIYQKMYYSLINRPIKSILFLLVIFLVGTFLTTACSIYQATTSFEKRVLNKIQPIVLIAWNENYEEQEKIEEVLNELKVNEYITYIENRYTLDLGQFLVKIYDEDGNVVPFDNFFQYLIAIDNPTLSDQMTKQTFTKEGRFFTIDEIINYSEVLYLNIENGYTSLYENIHIDDKLMITISPNEFLKGDQLFEKQLTLIGKGENISNSNVIEYHYRPYTIYGNFHYIPYALMCNLSDELKSKYIETIDVYSNGNEFYEVNNRDVGKMYVFDTFVQLNNGNQLSSFIFDLKSSNSDLIKNIVSYSDSFNDISSIMKNIKFISIIILLCATIASILLLSMLIYVFITERRHEIGIYLALGESRKNVILQIMLEVIIVGMLGIGCAIFSGNIVAKSLSREIVSREIAQYEELNEDSDYRIDEEEFKAFDVSINNEYIFMVINGGFVVLFISCLYPMNNILKMKAKKMLQ